jgi:hypothetical protein
MAEPKPRELVKGARQGAYPCILAALLLMTPAPTYRTQDEASVDSRISRMAKVQKNWGPKMNTSGVRITLKEVKRVMTPQGTSVYYHLLETGLDTGQVYTLFSATLQLSTVPALEGVTFSESGLGVCAGRDGTCSGDKPNDPIDLVMFAAKGEPKRLAVVSANSEYKAFTYVVPFPIVGEDRGCTVEVILLSAKAEAVLIHASGLTPTRDVHFTGVSEGEIQRNDSKADEEGNYYQAALPFVKGKSHGSAKATIQSSGCSPSVSFEWGDGTDHNQ